MEDEKSDIVDFYPTEFQTDLNGKTQEWESVVLISFIDDKRLRKAMVPKLAIRPSTPINAVIPYPR